MSVQELKFKGDGPFSTDCEISIDDDKIRIGQFNSDSYTYCTLDRNQAYLLMLYLQEHLK